MFFNNRNTLWLLPTCLVLISCVCAYPGGYGEKRVNLKIGFDLTQEVNGEPALRVREFEDSGNYPRAVESTEDKEQAPKQIRADSFSASEEETTTVKEVKEKKVKREREHEREKEHVRNHEKERERESSRESKASNESTESDSDDDKIKSTQGVRAGEFDPDDDGKVHGRDADADSEGNGR